MSIVQMLKAKLNEFNNEEMGIMDAVVIVKGLVMILAIGAIGVFVIDRTLTATGTPANANLTIMQNNLIQTGVTGSSFIIILVIAFIGGIAISYLAFISGTKKQ